jgi:protein-L-isoaspartate O-methyltransferase
VVAIERDGRTISRARARAAEAGFHNINFVQTDIAEYSADSSFDAAVGTVRSEADLLAPFHTTEF